MLIDRGKTRQFDFYDPVAKTGVDKSVVYKRKEQVFYDEKGLNIHLPWDTIYRGNAPSGRSIHGEILAFCGKLYPYFTISEIGKNTKIFYNLSFLDQFKISKWSEKEFKEFFNISKNNEYLNLKYKSPVIIIKKSRNKNYNSHYQIVVNPLLKDIEFYRILDPYQTYQQIYQYLSSNLCSEKQMEDIPDKYKLLQKGFDKHSFRHPVKLRDLAK